MKEKPFFQKKVGHQTIIGFITILSFPFLYYGQLSANKTIMFIGMSFVICGMLSSAVLKFLHNGGATENNK